MPGQEYVKHICHLPTKTRVYSLFIKLTISVTAQRVSHLGCIFYENTSQKNVEIQCAMLYSYCTAIMKQDSRK